MKTWCSTGIINQCQQYIWGLRFWMLESCCCRLNLKLISWVMLWYNYHFSKSICALFNSNTWSMYCIERLPTISQAYISNNMFSDTLQVRLKQVKTHTACYCLLHLNITIANVLIMCVQKLCKSCSNVLVNNHLLHWQKWPFISLRHVHFANAIMETPVQLPNILFFWRYTII